MATFNGTASFPQIQTDAQFREHIELFRSAFTAAGLVQAADTGQINPTTVVRAVAANTSQGYEIWRTNDATGGFHNLHIKIEYGSTGSTNIMGIWLTFGWSTNGAGTMTGVIVARTQTSPSGTPNSGTAPTYAAGSGTGTGNDGGAWFGINQNALNVAFTNICFGFERARNAAGAFIDEFVILYFETGANRMRIAMLSWLRGATAYFPVLMAGSAGLALPPVNGGGSGGSYNADVSVGIYMMGIGGFRAPMAAFLIGDQTNHSTAFANYSITNYSAAKNYIGFPLYPAPTENNSSYRLLMRYD